MRSTSSKTRTPNGLAEVLSRLVQETITDKEGKIQQVVSKTDEEVIIIPDNRNVFF